MARIAITQREAELLGAEVLAAAEQAAQSLEERLGFPTSIALRIQPRKENRPCRLEASLCIPEHKSVSGEPKPVQHRFYIGNTEPLHVRRRISESYDEHLGPSKLNF